MDASSRLTPGQIDALAGAVALALGGRTTGGVADADVRAIQTRMGVQALSLIREDFLRKAKGSPGEAGDTWPPLKPETVARRRRSAGDLRQYQAAVRLARKAGRTPPTKAEWFGARQVEILRDTGLLLNSLTPGVGGAAPVAEQVFKVGPGEVIVGTKRAGARAHHRGVPSRNLPQRRLWPERLPDRWLGLIARQARDGILELVARKARGG